MNKILLFIYFVVLIYSCSSDNTELLLEEQTVKEGVYAGDNQWIYEQMNHYYLCRVTIQPTQLLFIKLFCHRKIAFLIVRVIRIIQVQ